MTTYAIGDVQGCYQPLMKLLDKIQFDPNKDTLWFTGDLVNRGYQSLEVLRYVKSLGDRAITVLGNHDLTLLGCAMGAIPFDPNKYTFLDILDAPDKAELIDWFRKCPMMHHDKKLGYTMIHAGIYPQWDLNQALALAQEVETILQGPDAKEYLKHLFGNEPKKWDPGLTGAERFRFIANACARMRFCTLDGELDLKMKGALGMGTDGHLPWFEIPDRKTKDLKIIFGHWAALDGQTTVPKVFALDTGCVWGRCLTAMQLEDETRITVPCSK